MRPLPGIDVIMRRFLTLFSMIVWLNLHSPIGRFPMEGGVDGLTLAPVYWNSSNPMFKPSINNPIIEVQLRDEIDFVCPWDSSNSTDGSTSAAEYYVIYQVSKAEFYSCSLFTGDRNPLMIVNCSAPDAKRRFTVIFEPYQSIPNVPEYKIGSTYYYTTTSTGKKDGLGNLNGGACQDFNMKLAFYVCCPTTVSQRSSSPSTSQSLPAPTGNEIPVSAQTASQVQPPKTSTATTKSSTSSSSSTTTSTSLSPKTSATSYTRIKDNSTTKITKHPQPSYQQTVNGCRKLAMHQPPLIVLLLLLTLLLYYRRT